MASFNDLFARLDPDPRVRGKQFEHVCKWFLENDPYYRDTVRKVWLWHDWEHRWGGDAGIDLVVEESDRKLWAVQCKAYDQDSAVTKKDVDKFLSESSRKWFSYRLLIATTDRLHPVAQRTIDDQEKKVGFIGLADLQTAEVEWAESPDRLRPAKPPKPAEPHDYQQEAIRSVVRGFQTADRGQLIMACGTGKTLTSLFIEEKLDAERTLVLLPSLSLLKQTLQVWRTHAKVPFEALPVCSDQTVNQSEDEAVAHTSELGVPVTTDPSEIAAFLRRRSGPRVVFSTYQSSPQLAAAFELGRVPQFDIAFADEAHRVAGDESTVFATILNAHTIKARRRLFMTATPRYYTGRVLKAAQDEDMEVATMNDPAKFGTVFHRLTFGEAIRRKLLTDYQVAVVGVDDATYREWAEKGTLVKRDGKPTDARTLASQIGLAKAMRKYDLRRVISFHSLISRARRFASEFPEVVEWMPARQRPKGALWTNYASGEMTAGERHIRLQRLRQLDDGERGLLANARCLSEGVDVPTLDGVAFIDPRHSEVGIVQAVGRAIRLAEDKTVGTIVIPVFINTETDAATALEDSSFKNVWDVIKALRAHDEELSEQIDSFRRELGRTGGARIPDKIHLDVSTAVGADFAAAFDVRLVEKTSARWEFWYGLLEKYTAEHETAWVPVEYVTDGYALGRWASVQRGLYLKGKLTDDRRDKLESLPGWSWDVLSDKWDFWIGLMNQFVAEHGHANVPIPYMVGEHNLRSWVATQRGLYRRGELSEERIRDLEALTGWTWDILEDNWTQHYIALKGFAEREGHARPPQRYVENGLRLGQWVAVQRNYRETVSPERVALLEALPGWSWNPFEDKWEEGFTSLLRFVRREGHAGVPKDHIEDGSNLGRWTSHQRAKRGSLSRDRRKRLEALPGWNWDLRADMWQRKFNLLREFQRREGHALVPQGHVEDRVKLGAWVQEQRTNRAKLSKERRKLLESVPGWTWDPHGESWERGFAALTQFANREGHARVPQGHMESGLNLGGWVTEQRSNRQKMCDKRRARLESVRGWSWNAVEDSWMEHLELLRAFAAREGHTRVPVDHVESNRKLGQWTRLRRREHRKLSRQRQALLEAIPGWYWGRSSDFVWDQKFAVLQKFVDREGHARVPSGHVEDGVKLGAWVAEQRAERGNLSPERVARLEALPGWSWTVSQDIWDERYELVRKFADREGHALVPQSYVENGVNLGKWVSVQRRKRDELTAERRARLGSLPGWSWDPHADRWEETFHMLQEYAKEHRTSRVPYSYKANGVNLGVWVSEQRSQYAKGKLDPTRQKRLERLPGWTWNPRPGPLPS
ncbi:MAG: Helicase associated domain protein [Mycobacterium sp.]|uniref:DEAD/DEAH box helicase n=1 Tax=Mycobacterium sp. TaxID=1785 RepID=UPI003F9628C8